MGRTKSIKDGSRKEPVLKIRSTRNGKEYEVTEGDLKKLFDIIKNPPDPKEGESSSIREKPNNEGHSGLREKLEILREKYRDL